MVISQIFCVLLTKPRLYDQIFKFSFLAFFVNFGSFFKGPADAHTSRLTDFVRHCQLSYRPGTRYNPQEQEFKGRRKGPSIKEVSCNSSFLPFSPVGPPFVEMRLGRQSNWNCIPYPRK